MPKKLKILQVITGLDFGGAEKVVLDLCKGLVERGHEVLCVSLSHKQDMINEFEKAGIEVIQLKIKKNPLSWVRGLKKFNAIIRNKKTDLVHAHLFHAMLFVSLSKLSGHARPLIFTPHSIKFGSWYRKYLIKALKYLRTKDVLFSKEHYSTLFKKDFVVIPNGIEIHPEKLSEEKFKTFTFLAVGRLESMKNHKSLIPVALELKKEKRRFQILIAGEGPLKNALQDGIDKNDLSDEITMLGFRDDILHLCHRSHALIMPSLWEGMPISILEAASVNLPVISTPVGSIPSLIDKNCGYSGQISDFPKMMSDVMDHYPEALKRATRLRQKIKREYSLERIISLHQDLYEQSIKPIGK
jgi:glycosyltransferase involved in cell wall biosynthesis